MPKQNYQKKPALDYNSIEQLEIAAADNGFSLFCENQKNSEPLFVQIGVLKRFFEIYKKNTGYESTDEIEISLFSDQQLNKDLKQILNLSFPKNFKHQERIKLDQQVFISSILLIKIQAFLANLDNKKDYDITCKKIFSILDRIIPYYPINLRDAFCLASVFSGLENLRVIFFKILNEILARTPKSFLFEQIQVYCLFAMLSWVSHAKSENFFLIVDVLLILEKYNLESLLLDDLTKNQTIFLLPSPLRIIDSVTQYFYAETSDNRKNKKLEVLNNIRINFLELHQHHYLQASLRHDFIFFMNNLLDFALTTDINNRTFILDHYNAHRPLIKKIFLSYDNPAMTDQEKGLATIILDMMEKWQACLQISLQVLEQSAQTGWQLSEQEKLENSAHNSKLLTETVAAKSNKKTLQAAQQFAKQQLKISEELALPKQKSELTLQKPSFIDDLQNKLIEKFLAIQHTKHSEQENFLNNEEQIITKEVVKYLALAPIQGALDKDLLSIQVECLANLANKISEINLHTIFLLYVNLLDVFLSRIKNKLHGYKKQYMPLIKKMLDRHGQKDFSSADHALNKQIKQQSKAMLDNLTETNDYCACVLQIFEISNILKSEIKALEYYKIWNLPINFRKHEYEEIYKQTSEYLIQFLNYRENKKMAFSANKIPVNKNNKKWFGETNEAEISLKLADLLEAIKKITNRINENEVFYPKVFLVKQSQARAQTIQNTKIESNRLRAPKDFNRLDDLRRSQSFTDLYTKPMIFSLFKNDLASIDGDDDSVSKDSGFSFFSSESESKNKKAEEENLLLGNDGRRRMSL